MLPPLHEKAIGYLSHASAAAGALNGSSTRMTAEVTLVVAGKLSPAEQTPGAGHATTVEVWARALNDLPNGWLVIMLPSTKV